MTEARIESGLVAKGLAGVVVDETAISDVRSEGVLIYRGITIEQLVEKSLSQVVHLLLDAEVPVSLSPLTEQEIAWVLALPRDLHPMQILQSAVPILQTSAQDDLFLGCEIANKLPTLLLSYLHGRAVVPDESDYASAFLSGLNGVTPSSDQVAAFTAVQILQLEHSFNAGTFAARVVASTLATLPAAISAGFGALSGPLHGGADQRALELIDSLASRPAIDAYIDETLKASGRIPGMGHREYRRRDPRAVVLEEWAIRLSNGSPHAETYARLKYLEESFAERMTERGKDVYANVEFYKGLVYRMLGLPNDYFTAGFALARVFGYIAHFVESREDNKIFRPQATYVGRKAS